MNGNAYKVAVGGTVSALCLFLMLLGSVIPVLYLVLPMISGMLIGLICKEINLKWAFLTYLCVCVLGAVMTPDKESALVFTVLFGHYPILKHIIRKLKLKPLAIALKLLVYNVCIITYVQLTVYLLGSHELAESLSKYGVAAVLFLAFTNFIFLIYDALITVFEDAFVSVFKHGRIKK
ncbi:MAG: hypothetical protein LBR54_00835 [Oscillospiraceae bacterium]|jgi:hypothetical protein|nr:hypothetical protein [Oscillospiraceae bacterium]